MQTVETRRWNGPEAIENLVFLQDQVINLSVVLPTFTPNHVHRGLGQGAIYLKREQEYPLGEILDYAWIDYQTYFGTKGPTIGRWGGGVECWFNLNTTRVERNLYQVDIPSWHRNTKNVRRRLTGEVRRQSRHQIGDLVIFEKSQKLITAMLATRV